MLAFGRLAGGGQLLTWLLSLSSLSCLSCLSLSFHFSRVVWTELAAAASCQMLLSVTS